MPPLLVEGTVWPGMGPPGPGPLRPPRPALVGKMGYRGKCGNRIAS
ncbi:hypothetical protein D623_10019168 [Myotis brandtii]|uniref:Uncharacterized protein n=1 Tax=Myotis brandtii TaxID=109478 RepID=S7N2B2_MYOBR|nr:hypothetical protein D623_10019168 [Myotis brandtii]